jgi:hypothetical protein
VHQPSCGWHQCGLTELPCGGPQPAFLSLNASPWLPEGHPAAVHLCLISAALDPPPKVNPQSARPVPAKTASSWCWHSLCVSYLPSLSSVHLHPGHHWDTLTMRDTARKLYSFIGLKLLFPLHGQCGGQQPWTPAHRDALLV